MEQILDIKFGHKTVGTANVCTEGLYYKISCRINLPGKRICLQTGKKTVDLGLCVPAGNMYGFETKRPVKSIPGTIIGFSAVEPYQSEARYWIDPDRSFGQISMLSKGRLQIEDEKYYLDMREDQTVI